MTSKTALVIRATGAQGKAAVHHLLKAGWNVHALVRIANDGRALALRESGAIVFEGTLSNTKAVESAIQGCSAVFLNQMPSFSDNAETEEAASLLQVAKSTGIKHVVHTTSLPIDDPDIRTKLASPPWSTLAPAIIGKADVEGLVHDSGLSWTIIRPGYFMTNFIDAPHSYFPTLAEGKLVTCLRPDTILPLVDPDDIGAFVARAINFQEEFNGKTISLASQKLGLEDIASAIEHASGQNTKVVYVESGALHKADIEEAKNYNMPPLDVSEIMEIGQLLSMDLDKYIDMDELKNYGVPLTSFQDFLEKNKDRMVPTKL